MQPLFPLEERLCPPILAVERREIEQEIAEGRMSRVDMLLQRFARGEA
jgi:hypothetical protein